MFRTICPVHVVYAMEELTQWVFKMTVAPSYIDWVAPFPDPAPMPDTFKVERIIHTPTGTVTLTRDVGVVVSVPDAMEELML